MESVTAGGIERGADDSRRRKARATSRIAPELDRLAGGTGICFAGARRVAFEVGPAGEGSSLWRWCGLDRWAVVIVDEEVDPEQRDEEQRVPSRAGRSASGGAPGIRGNEGSQPDQSRGPVRPFVGLGGSVVAKLNPMRTWRMLP